MAVVVALGDQSRVLLLLCGTSRVTRPIVPANYLISSIYSSLTLHGVVVVGDEGIV